MSKKKEKIGKLGDIVKVKRGYGRNFLIKYGKALKASKENIGLVNKKKTELNEKNVTLKKEARKIFELINKKEARPLKEWFNQHPSEPGQLNIEKWQL